MSAVILPAAFPLVGLGLASTYFLTVSHAPVLWTHWLIEQLFQGSKVMTHRKGANVEYPNMYASEEVAAKNPASFVSLAIVITSAASG